MAWTAQIGQSRQNATPDGSIYVTVTYTNVEDSTKTFTKEHRFAPGSVASADDIAAFVVNEIDKLAALYQAEQDLANVTTLQSTPRVVTNFQARAVMMQMPGATEGRTLFDEVDDYCKATGGVALQAWEYANNFYRTGTLVNSLAPVFGLTDAQVDEMFRQAAAVEA